MGRFRLDLQKFSWSPLGIWRLQVSLLWIFLILIDQLSKYLACKYLPEFSQAAYPYGGVAIGEFLGIQGSLVVVYNTGAAWNLLAHASDLLWGLRTALIAGLGYYVWHSSQPRYGWPLVIMLGGALSNWIDQSFHGFVIDMISVTLWGYMYPIFNVADSMICLAAMSLVLTSSKPSTGK